MYNVFSESTLLRKCPYPIFLIEHTYFFWGGGSPTATATAATAAAVTATTTATAEEFSSSTSPHPITHRDTISRSDHPSLRYRGAAVARRMASSITTLSEPFCFLYNNRFLDIIITSIPHPPAGKGYRTGFSTENPITRLSRLLFRARWKTFYIVGRGASVSRGPGN